MSRSRKKHPIGPLCCVGKGKAMKSAKREANIEIRRTNSEDLPDGKHYKKLSDRWTWPDDGKIRIDEPKWYRK
jgi:hypothetical protein